MWPVSAFHNALPTTQGSGEIVMTGVRETSGYQHRSSLVISVQDLSPPPQVTQSPDIFSYYEHEKDTARYTVTRIPDSRRICDLYDI